MIPANFKRQMYRGNRPHFLARVLNKISEIIGSLGLTPNYMVTLEVTGRKSKRTVSLPVAICLYNGERYLVSMLGEDAQWVQNIHASDGYAALRSGAVEQIRLVDVPVDQRAPIIKAYLKRAIGARAHIPVDYRASVAEFEKIAADFPVFQIVSLTSKK